MEQQIKHGPCIPLEMRCILAIELCFVHILIDQENVLIKLFFCLK